MISLEGWAEIPAAASAGGGGDSGHRTAVEDVSQHRDRCGHASTNRAATLCRSILAICDSLNVVVIAQGTEITTRAIGLVALDPLVGQGGRAAYLASLPRCTA
ncbi:hypothetical protein [Micromonospora sp. NPDC051141]|uniref:hypothetical protein n=1 Tax=Micromonospora sp. NPDC051141 TaxID=3364284 RepID=UPI0037BA561C